MNFIKFPTRETGKEGEAYGSVSKINLSNASSNQRQISTVHVGKAWRHSLLMHHTTRCRWSQAGLMALVLGDTGDGGFFVALRPRDGI